MPLESSLWLNIFPHFKQVKLTVWYALGLCIPKDTNTLSFLHFSNLDTVFPKSKISLWSSAETNNKMPRQGGTT